jgi:Tol biopolymer transport system component
MGMVRWGVFALTAVLLLTACSGSASAGPVFLVTEGGRLLRVEGDERKVLVEYDDGSFVLDPAVSHDGRRIAFVRQVPALTTSGGRLDWGADLVVAAADGRDARVVVEHALPGEMVQNPVWLPGDRSIIFAVFSPTPGGDIDQRIESVDLDSGRRSRLIANASLPALSPDGRTLAYVTTDPAAGEVRPVLFDLDSGRQLPVRAMSKRLTFFFSLAWSPDGRRLAFAASDPESSATVPPGRGQLLVGYGAHPFLQDLWLMDADGSNLRLVREFAEGQPSLAWAPDGPAIYIMVSSGLWRVEVETGSRLLLGEGSAFGQIALLPRR